MIAALGNLLARVAQGDLSVHEARAIACSSWLGGVKGVAEDLSAFAAELLKLRAEIQGDRYVESVVARPWPEIEKILGSKWLDDETKRKIRQHPDTTAKRQAFKWLTFGSAGTLGASKLVFRGPLTSEELEAGRRAWAEAWPEVHTWLTTLDPLVDSTCGQPIKARASQSGKRRSQAAATGKRSSATPKRRAAGRKRRG